MLENLVLQYFKNIGIIIFLHNKIKEVSIMKKQNYILKDEEIFVGLEDSKKTWQLCIRSGGMVLRETI